MEKFRTDLLTEIEALPENNLEYIKQEFYVAAIAAFHRASWTPDRTVVAVVGDVDPREVADWIATRWAGSFVPDADAGRSF